MWRNTVEPGMSQMKIWRMRILCWIPQASKTHSDNVILIAFPLQQRLHEGASLLRCTYKVCLVFIFVIRWETVLEGLWSSYVIPGSEMSPCEAGLSARRPAGLHVCPYETTRFTPYRFSRNYAKKNLLKLFNTSQLPIKSDRYTKHSTWIKVKVSHNRPRWLKRIRVGWSPGFSWRSALRGW
jgi:hypothetical protein